MRKLIAFAGALALLGCATAGTLTASQDFGKAQIVFNGLQQAAYACITSAVKQCTDNRDAIVSAADKGQIAETAGYTAQQAHNQAALTQATIDLAAAVSALQQLGVK